ncbi:MAG TPA: hypothetical protein VMV20_00840, partial [Chitinophagaceae bacterium]|nr:hypothetical protein [Chitinophagaceae bacterium]
MRKAPAVALFLAIFLAVLPGELFAQQDTIVLGDGPSPINSNISAYCQVLIDSSGDLTIGQVTHSLFADQKLFHEGVWENRKPHAFWL